MYKYSFFLLFVPVFSLAAEVTGKLKTIDDATKKPKSIVEITKAGDELKGKIVELIDPEEKDPTCKKCEGEKKDKPILGLEFIWGMKETKPGVEWADGKIFDSKHGTTYGCRLRLIENGEKLEVRGFVGISLFGRSQTWLRVNDEVKSEEPTKPTSN